MRGLRNICVVLSLLVAGAAIAKCPVERGPVKLGTDKDVSLVKSVAVPTSIAKLTLIDAPLDPGIKRDRRYAETELTVFEVSGKVTLVKPEDDSDYHIVLTDNKGRTIIVESTHPDCANGSRWEAEIANVRDVLDSTLGGPLTNAVKPNLAATITGVGFFDRKHGQTGVAPNGIELHPILHIRFDNPAALGSGPQHVVAPASALAPTSTKEEEDEDFDLYLLSLSWSPQYCAGHGGDDSQCGPAMHFGWVMHGLWPQFEKGWPHDCDQEPLPTSVREDAAYRALYPSKSLMGHEWAKHGTCSGLSPADYFKLAKDAKERVAIPTEYQAPDQTLLVDPSTLRGAFAVVNGWLPAESVVVGCRGGYVEEVRICLDKGASKAVSCTEDIRKDEVKACKAPLKLRAAR